MRIVLLFLILPALSCGEETNSPDYSGRWKMTETDADHKGRHSECWLEISQSGDRVKIRAYSEKKDWSCYGRGEIVEGKLQFRWIGEKKLWRGTAEVELMGNEIVGTFHRGDVEGTGTQYCRGVRE